MVKYFRRIVTAAAWSQGPPIRVAAGLVLALRVVGIPIPANAVQSIYVRASEPAGSPSGATQSTGEGTVVSGLGEGLRLARRLRRQLNGDEAIVITLQAGIHRLSEAVRLGPEDSGTAGAPLVILGEGGRATLSGGVALARYNNGDGAADALAIGIPESSRARLVRFELPEALKSVAGIDVVRLLGARSAPMSFELFGSLGPLWPARWPNTGYAAGMRSAGAAETLAVRPADRVRLHGWATSPEPWLGGYLSHEYSHETVPIAKVSRETGELSIAPSLGVVLAESVRYAVHHAASELDMPGEWVRSRNGDFVHVSQRQGEDALEVSLAPNLLVLEGASHVRFEGIAFERSRGGAVRVSGGLNIAFVGCTVRETGGWGIEFQKTIGSRVERCRFSDVGEEGVRLGGGERSSLSPGQNGVINSTFERFSRLGRSYHPAVAVDGVGQSVVGNYFADAPHAAIVLSGNEHLVEENEITRVAEECSDCGAIYMYRDWTARGTIIRHNFLHDIGGGSDGDNGTGVTRDVKGIYLDDFTSGIAVSENVLLRVDQGVFIGGGRDNLIERNLFVASEPAVHIDGRGLTWARAAITEPEGELRGHLADMPIAGAVWRTRYPRLAGILSESPERPSGNRVIGNLFAVTEPARFLPEVERSDVVVSGGNWEQPIAGAEVARLASASRAADLRRLAAGELVRFGLTGLPLEKMDRLEALGGSSAASARVNE